MTFNLDSKIYIFVLFALVFSVYFAFSASAITEDGYRELLLLKIGKEHLDIVKLVIPTLSFLSSLLILKSAKSETSFLVSLLFVFSPLVLFNIFTSYSLIIAISIFLFSLAGFLFFYFNSNMRYLFLLPLMLGGYLTYSYLDYSFSLAKIKDVGILLQLSTISVALIIKDKIDISVILFTIGLVSSLFLPSLSLVLLSFSCLMSMNLFLKHFDDTIFWAVFVLFLVFYILYNPASEGYFHILSSAIAVSLVSYFLLPLFNISKHQNAFFVFLIVISFSNSIFLFGKRDLSPINDKEIEFFTSLDFDGSFGVLDNEYVFEFYKGKKPRLLTVDDLLEKGDIEVDYVILSTDGLQNVLGSRPVIFRISSISGSNDGYSADYLSGNYLLRLFISKDSKTISDGMLFDMTQGGQGRTVSFPKLKPFNSNISLLEGNALINTENILDTNLYDLLFKKQTISEAPDIKLIKVR